MKVRGFILQPTYRIEAGLPVVHLYGRLETGKTFLVRDSRPRPHFYIRAADRERAHTLGAGPLTRAGKTNLAGEPVILVEVAQPSDTPALRDRLTGAGIACYEADVLYAVRYLIDRGIRGSLQIHGDWRPGRGVDYLFEDPEVSPADWTPHLSVLSLDIETDPQIQRLLSVALYGCGASEVLLLTPRGYPVPEGAVPFRTEDNLLRGLCRRIRKIDPDVITGWNVVDFDLAVLSRLAERHGLSQELGRGPGPVTIRAESGWWRGSQATVPGRVVLDGIDLLRGASVRMAEYNLDHVARTVLGEGKTIAGRGRAGEILQAFQDDRPRLVAYNLTDARLVHQILERLHLVELAVERSRLTGLPPQRVSASIAAFDFLYLSELYRRNIVAPSVGSIEGEPEEPTVGGHVLEPEPGLYRNVLTLDFRSLYPSVIRTFQIDPLGFLPDPDPEDDPIVAPNGAAFSRRPGILTQMLDGLFPRREAARAVGDKVADQAIKVLMNSFYGVMGTSACRFHSPDLANAITSFGREILLWSKGRIEEYGHRVLYGDTDSLFVASDREEPAAARSLGATLVERLNHDLADHVRATWRVDSRLELEFEQLYLRLMLLPARHGSGGARKRYAGLVEEDGERQVVFTGMEAVRRDWTELAKEVQRELYRRLFTDQPVEEYLMRVVAEVREGRHDGHLVYRKSLRKDLHEYTATTPPHVAAARKMSGKPGRLITYVMTREGPEPAGERRSPLDHEHYVQKQVRPVAEPVLDLLDLDFDKVVGDDTQMELF